MSFDKKFSLLKLAGAGIIIVWLIMIGLLIRKTHISEPVPPENENIAEFSPSSDSPVNAWMEIFLKGDKIGYSVRTSSFSKGEYFIREDMFLMLNLMGRTNNIHVNSRSVADSDFHLKEFRFTMDSGIVKFEASGRVEGKQMFVDVGKGADRRTRTLQLDAPPVIGSGISSFFAGRALKEGQSFSFHVFDPSTMARTKTTISVVSEETVVIRGVSYKAFKLEADMWGRKMSFWLDRNGSVLKERGPMGLTLVRSDASHAPEKITGGTAGDFYETAAVPIKRKLKNPRNVAYLVVRAAGIDVEGLDPSVLNRDRQRYSEGVLEVTKEDLAAESTYQLPFNEDDAEMQEFIMPEANIQSRAREIVEMARRITGDTRDPLQAARKIVGGVYDFLEKKPLVSIPNALDVLRTGSGDCNEHAVLSAALLRASGIPARVCVGLVYTRGKFFYHSWNDFYTGRWISADSTLNQVPCDATHIKLVEGGLEKQVGIMALMDRLSLEVIEYRHD